MSIFDRIFNRLATANSARVTTELRSRLLRIEALEDRRMLAAAPLDFTVENTGDTGLRLQWINNPDATEGYEIQSSVNGLNDEANPDLWKTGLWRKTETADAGDQFVEFDRFRSYYFRIQSLPAESTPLWSPIEYTTAPAEDKVVKVSAAVLTGPDAIKLQWPEELRFNGSKYTIFRKTKDDLVWDELVTDHSDNFYEDKVTAPVDPIQVGKAYEYRVERCATAGCQFSPSGTGYVYAAIDLPLSDPDSTIQSPGTVILVVDNTQAAALVTELARLENDLIAEGWKVNRLTDVAPHITPDPNDPVPDQITNRDNAINIRQAIVYAHGASYDETTGTYDVKAVFLIGHVPIPMSGHNCPDGHGERPMPTDLFYGEMDGVVDIDNTPGGDWTDATYVPDASCAQPVADVDNDPDDGAFDQKTVPTDGDGKPVELMVGRVDMRDLTFFGESETDLLRRYLDKDHAFRTGQVAVERKGRIRDYHAGTPVVTSAGPWQTLSGLFGPAAEPEPLEPDNIDVNKWPDSTWPLVLGLRSIASGDFTGDSSVEIVTASADDGRIAWHDRDSQGNLVPHIVSDKVRQVSSVLLADLDGDGNDDILSASLIFNETAGTTFDQILWYDHVGTPTPTFQNRGKVAPEGDPTDTGGWVPLIAAADLNGDNKVDVLTATYDATANPPVYTISWYDNDGDTANPNPAFDTQHKILAATTSDEVKAILAVDVDGDGKIDVVTVTYDAIAGTSKITWYENDGDPVPDPVDDPTFTTNNPVVDTTSAEITALVAADVDGGNGNDLIVASASGDKLVWYVNDGMGGFDLPEGNKITTSLVAPNSLFAADVDGIDGIDIVVSSAVDNTVAWYKNDGSQGFSEQIVTNLADGARAAHAADVDGDGLLEIVAISTKQPSIAYYENTGGIYEEHVTEMLPSNSFLWGHVSSNAGNPTRFESYRMVSTETLAAPDGVSVSTVDNGPLPGVDNTTVFNSFLGSYLMEWQQPNSMLRAILADEGYGLASTWAGLNDFSSDWGRTYYQHMSLGETIGAGLLNTQNHAAYDSSDAGVHISLLGDPTLRMFVVRPPGEVTRVVGPLGVTDVRWDDSPDEEVTGYHVYRSTGPGVAFVKLTTGGPTSSPYQDTEGGVNYSYLVRAVKTETTGGGTFVNLSAGVYSQDPYNHPGLVMNQGTTTDDVALIPNFVSFSSDEVTVEVTFASDIITGGSSAGVPIFSYATDQQPIAFWLFVNSEPENRLMLTINGFSKKMAEEDVVRDLFDGADHHIAVAYDSAANVARVYADGVAISGWRTFNQVGPVDDDLGTGGMFVLGQDPDNETAPDFGFDTDQILKGTILETRIFNDLRSAAEILSDSTTALNPESLPANLVHAWDFRSAGGLVSGNDMLGGKHFEIRHQGVGLLLNEGQATQDSALVTDFSGFSSNLLTVELTFAADEREITSELITPLISYATGQQATAFMLYVQKSGSKLRFKVNGSSTLTLFEGPIVAGLFDGAPHHIALTYNADTRKAQVFLDGTPKTLKEVPGNPGPVVTGGVFALGQDPDNVDENDEYGFDPEQIFSREISDVRIYDEVRSAAQIQLDMITPLDPAALPASLAHAWQMRVGSDLTSGADLVGGKHLTVSTNVYGLVLGFITVDYAVATSYDGFSSDAVTVEMTFSHEALATGEAVPLLSYGNSVADDAFTLIAEEDAAGYKLSLIVNDEQQLLAQGTTVTGLFDGGIHHLALVWDSATGHVDVYIDGALAGSGDFTGTAVAGGGTFVLGERIEDFGAGDYQTDGQEFDGTIYEVRVYDDVRTQEQILLDMVTPLDANNLPVGLVSGWQFLGSGTAVSGSDIKGNNDLTIVLQPCPLCG